MWRSTAHHEAGHAVAYIRAFRALGQDWPAFERVVIRPNASGLHLNGRGVEIDCVGVCEATDICIPVVGLAIFNGAQRPELQSMMLRRMEWEIMVKLAGPFATAAHAGIRAKQEMRWAALLSGGTDDDYKRAESVLADYKKATRRAYGLRRFEDRTRDLVLGAWPAIEALAVALLNSKSGALEYDEAVSVVLPLL